MTEITITRYPMSMTGKKLRKKLGIDEPRVFSDHNFKINRRFTAIPMRNRLSYLRKMVSIVKEAKTWAEISSHRRGFDVHKTIHLPMREDCTCYVCGGVAILRHHVITVMNGGRNKRNNVVPLCNGCHKQVHQWQ